MPGNGADGRSRDDLIAEVRRRAGRRRLYRRGTIAAAAAATAAIAVAVPVSLAGGGRPSTIKVISPPSAAPSATTQAPTGSSTTSTTTASTSTTSTGTAPSLTQQVIYEPFVGDRVDPALHVTSRGSGSCYRFGGGAAGRYYYRCGTDQPCFAGPQGTATPLVCPFLGNPTTDQVILWTATSVDTSAPPATVKTPFAMKLSNGTVCVFVSAAWGGLGPFDCQAAMANASAVPADCHEPVEGSPYWTVECQNAKTDSSPFSSATVLMVWF